MLYVLFADFSIGAFPDAEMAELGWRQIHLLDEAGIRLQSFLKRSVIQISDNEETIKRISATIVASHNSEQLTTRGREDWLWSTELRT